MVSSIAAAAIPGGPTPICPRYRNVPRPAYLGTDEFLPDKRPIHTKPTASEKMPMDVLLLKHNGEIC